MTIEELRDEIVEEMFNMEYDDRSDVIFRGQINCTANDLVKNYAEIYDVRMTREEEEALIEKITDIVEIELKEEEPTRFYYNGYDIIEL